MKHFDVTTAYLNGSIKEKIYMEPPLGLSSSLERIVESKFR